MPHTLVFGASLKPRRYSNLAMRRLSESGVDTVGFGPVAGTVFGVPVYDRLEDLEPAETVTLYMGPERQSEFYDAILRLAKGRVLFNPGTENPGFARRLREAGIAAEEACTLVLLATGTY